jgi:choice-of-anchor B domain-containing protein
MTMKFSRLVFALAALLPAAQLGAQQFGAAAAVGDGVLLIAEPVKDSGPATLHVYRRDGNQWVPDGTLSRPEKVEERDYFGRFVALDGNTLFVGGTTIEQSTGMVWQFQRSASGWDFVGQLRPTEVVQGDSYGRVGLISDGLFFVSSLGHQTTGAVWVYRREGDGRWVQEARLLPPEGTGQQHFFGWSMAYDPEGDRLLVGAITPAAQSRGAAYIFHRDAPGQWTREAAIVAAETEPGGLQLGTSVAWSGGTALVSAPGANGFAGEVRTWRRGPAGEWTQGPSVTAEDPQQGASFGASLASQGGILWVGAPGADASGRVYQIAYDAANARVQRSSKLAGLDPDVGDGFGSVMALGADAAVIGQTGDDFGLGSAIIVTRSGNEWQAAAKLIGTTPTPLPNLTGSDVRCQSDKADQFPCENVDIRSFLSVSAIGGGRGAETNDVWGWTDPQSNREYAIVGRSDGTSFIDVTDPNRPIYLGSLPKTPGSRGNAWRDIKVYKDHAYVVADGALNHGVQVFDLTRLRNVQSAPATFEPDHLYTDLASAHNIVINEESGFAYAVGSNSGGQTCGGALHMIDIREPKNPRFAGCFADPRTGQAGTGYSHDAQCVNYQGPDVEHQGKEICIGSNETALSIADVTDKANPKAISVADYPNVGYAHQGWITPDFRYFYMDDEGDESASVQANQPMRGTRTLIWDIQDLDDPIMVKEHFGETFTIDHNLYIKDDLMYQSNYVSGLRILDISDRLNPREVGFIDTVPWSEEVEFDGSWSNYPFFPSGTIVVSSGKEGVFFVRFNRPLIP